MDLKTKLNITKNHQALIRDLLNEYIPNVKAWAYGSRVNGTASPSSDLDMVVFTTTQQQEVASLREAFEESDLPFRVDLFIWEELPESFRRNIKSNHLTLQ